MSGSCPASALPLLDSILGDAGLAVITVINAARLPNIRANPASPACANGVFTVHGESCAPLCLPCHDCSLGNLGGSAWLPRLSPPELLNPNLQTLLVAIGSPSFLLHDCSGGGSWCVMRSSVAACTSPAQYNASSPAPLLATRSPSPATCHLSVCPLQPAASLQQRHDCMELPTSAWRAAWRAAWHQLTLLRSTPPRRGVSVPSWASCTSPTLKNQRCRCVSMLGRRFVGCGEVKVKAIRPEVWID